MDLNELVRKFEGGGLSMEEVAKETEEELKTLLTALQRVEGELIDVLKKHHLTDDAALELLCGRLLCSLLQSGPDSLLY